MILQIPSIPSLSPISAFISALPVTPLQAVLLVPAVAVVLLALIPNYRLGAFLNVFASGLTFLAGASLLFEPKFRSDILILDDFNVYLVTLTTVSYTHLTLPTIYSV